MLTITLPYHFQRRTTASRPQSRNKQHHDPPHQCQRLDYDREQGIPDPHNLNFQGDEASTRRLFGIICNTIYMNRAHTALIDRGSFSFQS